MHCVDFMRIWLTYDKDQSGFMDEDELEAFVVDYLKGRGKEPDAGSIDSLRAAILNAVDSNSDGRLSLSELASFLRVEDNFLERYEGSKLTRKQFLEVFDHYDKNGDGKIAGAELYALIRDLMRKGGEDPEGKDLERYKSHILKIYDISCDEALGKEELARLIPIMK